MILVVDIQKGFEPQTGECLILGEISKKPLIVVLNKIDMIDEGKRENVIEKMTKRVSKTLEPTIFKRSPIIPVAAMKEINIEKLISALIDESKNLQLNRDVKSPFVFAFDHCFSIKGSGTVLSGTVLQGTVKVNDTIEIPNLKSERKVKSMQMFRRPIDSAQAGDRIGICITNFDSKLLERGLLCHKGYVESAYAVVMKVNRIKYFKREIKSKAKFHCSIGHETVMASIVLFSSRDTSEFNFESEYLYEDTLPDEANDGNYFVLIEFEHPVLVFNNMLLIASKLDTEQTNVCRLAFYGNVALNYSSIDKNFKDDFLHKLKIYKEKSREGIVQRLVNDGEVIVGNLFKKETDRSKFERMKCKLSTGEIGFIAGAFGQSSKVRVQFTVPLNSSTIDSIKNSKGNEGVKVILAFKKFIFDKNHRIMQ
jgi:selenocysteine-specific elongation factor